MKEFGESAANSRGMSRVRREAANLANTLSIIYRSWEPRLRRGSRGKVAKSHFTFCTALSAVIGGFDLKEWQVCLHEWTRHGEGPPSSKLLREVANGLEEFAPKESSALKRVAGREGEEGETGLTTC